MSKLYSQVAQWYLPAGRQGAARTKNMEKEKYYAYAIYSEKFNRIYIGLSNNPNRRLREHNESCVRPTRPYKPWQIIYVEFCGTRKEAREKEKYYKTGCGREFIKQYIPR